jgi:hypothetical protein
LKKTGISKFRVPISRIGSLRFDLAFDYKFRVCFGLFPIGNYVSYWLVVIRLIQRMQYKSDVKQLKLPSWALCYMCRPRKFCFGYNTFPAQSSRYVPFAAKCWSDDNFISTDLSNIFSPPAGQIVNKNSNREKII